MVNRVLLSAVVLLLLAGCVVKRSTYRDQAAQREAVEAELASKTSRVALLEQENGELSQKLERRELERASLGKERVDLLNEIEDLRHQLDEEKRLRMEKEAAVAEIKGSYSSLVEQLEAEVAKGQIEIQELRGRLQIRALERILFDSGSATIKPEGRTVLAKVAEQLRKQHGYRIRIEGHTDPVSISTREFPSNWELSCARAARVLRFLVEQGLEPERMSAVGLGPYQPIDSNDTPKGRARNRRIEIVLVPESEG
jgi:chemotaxis protein MotB